MEGWDGDEYDCVCECGKDVLEDDYEEVSWGDGVRGGKYWDGELCYEGGDEVVGEVLGLEVYGGELLGLFFCVVFEVDFKGEVDEDGEGYVVCVEFFV